ncbi:hypothetical protein BIV60_00755 [Bacillus sp. MUM 116]|nr:hypothetical protein BIV60_00755 [Bacillus sp. MUM 116]
MAYTGLEPFSPEAEAGFGKEIANLSVKTADSIWAFAVETFLDYSFALPFLAGMDFAADTDSSHNFELGADMEMAD